mgnify:CR=1 FL=1
MLRRRNLFQERYNRFLTELKNEILSGDLKPGEFILPENTLSQKYKISRVSIRKALAELVEEGLIEKIPGKGNRVRLPDSEATRQTLSLTWFSGSYETEIVREWIRRFEATHPYVKVELRILQSDEYATLLAQMIEQGRGPDLFFVSDAHIRHLEALNKLDLFAPYLPPHLQPERDSYPQLFRMFTYEGELKAVPIHFSPVVICYNAALFAAAGITEHRAIRDWDELLELAKRCTSDTNGDGMVDYYGFCLSASMNRWPVFVLQNGGAFKSEDGTRSVFGSDQNIEALQFCVDLMYKYGVSPIYSHGSDYLAESLFKKERAAMVLSTYYFMNEFRDTELSWDVLPVPANKSNGTLLICGALGINKYSDKQLVAQSLIDYLTSVEAQTVLKRNGCTIPMLREVAENDKLLNPRIHPPHYNHFKSVMPYAYSLQDLHLKKSDIDLLYEELHELWANLETPAVVCRRIEDLMNGVPNELKTT